MFGFSLAFFFLFTIPCFALPSQVILLRHAEKPYPVEGSHLSEEGWVRARALASYFSEAPDAIRFGKIAGLYSVRPDKPEGSVRSIETLTPTSNTLRIKIESKFTKLEVSALAKEILQSPKFHGRTVVVCWEHKRIPEIARTFGAIDVPSEWGGKVYDKLWYLRFDSSGKVEFSEKSQEFGDLLALFDE
ncbi:MAG: hypothetical protein KGP28_08990 [Bdellovibrionales bacterium]|nr:hypothetical protein [Bdellovibrionales bacterium]